MHFLCFICEIMLYYDILTLLCCSKVQGGAGSNPRFARGYDFNFDIIIAGFFWVSSRHDNLVLDKLACS